MYRILVFISLIWLSSLSYANGFSRLDHNDDINRLGPNDCLSKNDSCPNWFLQEVICNLSSDVCIYDAENHRMRLVHRLFSERYILLIKSKPLPIIPEAIQNTHQEQLFIDHEMYEHIICTLDASLCYQQSSGISIIGSGGNANSLGIYLVDDNSDASCSPDEPVCDNTGGPPDAAICQKMPDACSATEPD